MTVKEKKKTCFVITPIGASDDPIRRHIEGVINIAVKPALDGYTVNVAHAMQKPGSITKQVIQEILESDLIIANLTNNNPNVMYELAFSHSLGKPVIQIMEEGTKIPFDIVAERTFSYVYDPQGIQDLKNELVNCMAGIDFNDDRQGPIYDALKSINYRTKIIGEINSSNEEEDKDALGYIIDKLDELEAKVSERKLLKFTITFEKMLSQEDLNTITDILKTSKYAAYKVSYSENRRMISFMGYEVDKDEFIGIINYIKERVPDNSFRINYNPAY